MTSRKKAERVLRVGVAVIAAAWLAGCGGGEDEQASRPAAQAPAPPPPPPEPSPLEDLEMDARVVFPPEREPSTRELAQAIAQMASAIARGDASSLRAYLAGPDQMVLDTLEASGGWDEATADVEAVRVTALEERDQSVMLALAVQRPGGATALAWEGTSEDGSWTFSAMPLEPATARTASALDGAVMLAYEVPGPEFDVFPEAEEDEDDNRRRSRRGGRSPSGPGPSLPR